MAIIVPTITTDDPATYQKRLEDFLLYADRIHIDVTDGEFAPSRTLSLNQLYWPEVDDRKSKIDLHLMFRRPIDWLDQIVSLKPDRVILHAESDDAGQLLPRIFDHLRRFGIQTGVALLPQTQPNEANQIIASADAVLVFGGHLGYQGGKADLTQLTKVKSIKAINQSATIEWDGGANLSNIVEIAAAGVDQINVGGAISSVENARAAYDELVATLQRGENS